MGCVRPRQSFERISVCLNGKGQAAEIMESDQVVIAFSFFDPALLIAGGENKRKFLEPVFIAGIIF